MQDTDREAPCPACEGSYWVCENHENKPWGGNSISPHACDCGPGMPCLLCNKTEGRKEPKMPEDFKVICDSQGRKDQ